MERPTHSRLHVRQIHDAQKVFEAVRSGKLRLVQRRLNEFERHKYVVSGSVFVWEESEEDTGLKRWTDGKTFGQSRMRGDFLFYEEKFEGVPSPSRTPTTMWSSSVMRAEQNYPFTPTNDQDPYALMKQTYSAFFLCPKQKRQRKWHMTAYFTYADLHNLPTTDKDPVLRNVQVPAGVYRSAKARSKGSSDGDSSRSASSSSLSSVSSSPPQYQAYTHVRAQSPANYRVSGTSRSGNQNGLPSLTSMVSNSPTMPCSGSRVTEDQRLIHLLNSRTVL